MTKYDYTVAGGRYYFMYQKVGMKLIPKCGSTTVRKYLGDLMDVKEDLYLCQPVRLTIIRNPLNRLMSFYTSNFIHKPGFKGQKRMAERYDIPVGATKEVFLDYALQTEDEYRDWHFQSFHRQCPHLDGSIIVPIEKWNTVCPQFGLPKLPATRENQSDERVKKRTEPWTAAEVEAILSDPDWGKDYEVWQQRMEEL